MIILDNAFTKIQGTFEVDANPGITVFADDIYVHENATSKDILFLFIASCLF